MSKKRQDSGSIHSHEEIIESWMRMVLKIDGISDSMIFTSTKSTLSGSTENLGQR